MSERATQMSAAEGMIELERLKNKAALQVREDEIAALRRRVSDLEDFLRGCAIQFGAVVGR